MDIADGFQYQKNLSESAAPPVETARVVGAVTNGIVEVNSAGAKEKVKVPEGILLADGDIVLLLRGRQRCWIINVLSTSLDNPAEGVVGTVVGGSNTIPITMTKNGRSITVAMPFNSAYSPVAGHTVQLIWRPNGTGGYVNCKLGTVPLPPPPPTASASTITLPTAPPTPATSGYNPFAAQDAVSFRGGKWRTDTRNVVQWDWGGYGNNDGSWFYGSQPTDYLSGATVTRLQIKIKRTSGGDYASQAPNFYLHTSRTRPGGNVTTTMGPYNGGSIGIGETKMFDLPASWGQTIVDSGGGITIKGSPYIVNEGLDRNSESGLIIIDWTR